MTEEQQAHAEVDRNAVRRTMRGLRRGLTLPQRRHYEEALARRLITSSVFKKSRNIAFYLPNDGEVDLASVVQQARAMGKQCFLPVLSPAFHNRLWFARYNEDTPLALNCFGIPEPATGRSETRPVWSLDLVLTPLVAFDDRGNRLGMGGGFYDRTLAYLSRRTVWRKPRLIGTAYELQRVDTLPHEPWDVPLQGVVTNAAFHHFGNQ